MDNFVHLTLNIIDLILLISLIVRRLNKEITDIDIIYQILNGSKPAFRLLYDRYSKFYMLTCLRYVKNKSDADDLLQESLIKIYKELHQYDPEKGEFIHWSKRIVINMCLMHLRKRKVLFSTDFSIDFGLGLRTKVDAIDQLNLKDLTNLILEMPKGYRTVFNMFVIDGYSHKEIAEHLGVTESTSKSQLRKARKMLQSNIANSDRYIAVQYAS